MHRHWQHRREHHARGHFGPFGGRDWARGPGRHGGGRAGRILEHGDLRLVVLALLAEKPRHGYEIMRDLEARTGGAYSPSPGVIYPTLSLLVDESLAVTGDAEGGRKLYEITDAGRQALEEGKATVDAVFARLDEAASRSAGASHRIARAMGNLGSAIGHRFQKGGVGEAQIDAMVRAIDEAARIVETV